MGNTHPYEKNNIETAAYLNFCQSLNFAIANILSLSDNSIAPTRETVMGGGEAHAQEDSCHQLLIVLI